MTEKACCDEIEIFMCFVLILNIRVILFKFGPGGMCDEIGANT